MRARCFRFDRVVTGEIMRHTAALFILGGLLIEPQTLTAQDFRSALQDLGPFPNASVTEPRAINNRGDVVGYPFVDGRDIAFLWTRRHGYEVIAENALPNDINNRGEVVGLLDLCETSQCVQNGFLWNRQQGLSRSTRSHPSPSMRGARLPEPAPERRP